MTSRPGSAGSALVVRFTRISPTHHRLDLVRADGSREAIELESKSCLRHDLVHFALETEARLRDSFYGRLARGVAYATLAQPMQSEAGSAQVAGGLPEGSVGESADELTQTERVVGPLQGALRAGFDADTFMAAVHSFHEALGEAPPPWLSAELFTRVAERMRQLEGAWRATPFGSSLELRFDAAS